MCCATASARSHDGAQACGQRPLDVVVEDPTVDPGLLLFMAFVVQAYSDDASFPPPTPA